MIGKQLSALSGMNGNNGLKISDLTVAGCNVSPRLPL